MNLRIPIPYVAPFLLLSMILSAPITAASADYTIQVTSTTIPVHISGALLQALPNPPAVNSSSPFGQLPVFKIHIEGGNSSLLSSFLNKALKEKSPSVSATQVTFDGSSNGTIYHYDLGFNVVGLSSEKGDAEIFDLAWRSFSIRDDIKAGNFSINTLVNSYLENRILLFAQLQPTSPPPLQRVRRWYLNDHLIDRSEVGDLTDNLTLFNFASMSTPLTAWTASYDIGDSRFLYKADTGFNLTLHEQFNEAGEIGNLLWNAVYKLKAVIEAPWGSVASNNSLILESKNNWSTWVMMGLIITSSGLLGGTSLFERRVRDPQKSLKSRKTKR